MNVYVVSDYDWEFSTHYVLTHDNKFSREEFKNICTNARKEAYRNCIKEIKEFNKSHSWSRSITVSNDTLCEELKFVLVDRYDFKVFDVMQYLLSDEIVVCNSDL